MRGKVNMLKLVHLLPYQRRTEFSLATGSSKSLVNDQNNEILHFLFASIALHSASHLKAHTM